ncbi:hypothetical protein FPOAC2_13118 [Fusarium poae]
MRELGYDIVGKLIWERVYFLILLDLCLELVICVCLESLFIVLCEIIVKIDGG